MIDKKIKTIYLKHCYANWVHKPVMNIEICMSTERYEITIK